LTHEDSPFFDDRKEIVFSLFLLVLVEHCIYIFKVDLKNGNEVNFTFSGCHVPEISPWKELNLCLSASLYLEIISLKELKEEDFIYGSNWFIEEIYENTTYRWMSNNATLLIYNEQNITEEVNLSFKSRSLDRERHLEIYLNNELKEKMQILDYEWFGNKTIIPLHLKPEFNEIKFHSIKGCQIPEDIGIWEEDDRCLTVSFTNVNIRTFQR
jgi:hypothetical protein